MSGILESAMLVCFGLSWPMNLIKNIKAKTAKSMSLKFILLIIVGYIAGITAKIVNHQINYVLVVYILNIIIVSMNLVVYFRNRNLDKKATGKENTEMKNLDNIAKMSALEKKYNEMNKISAIGGNVILGSDYFSEFNFSEMASSCGFDENIYNRSVPGATIDEVCKMAGTCVTELSPGNVFVNLGEYDITRVDFNMEEFINKYEWLLYSVHNKTKAKIYTVGVYGDSKLSKGINKEIRKLSENYGCHYIDINSAKASSNPELRIFNILKSFMRSGPIDFYEAMNSVSA